MFCAYKSIFLVHCCSYKPMMRNVHFHCEVSRANFKKRKDDTGLSREIPSTNLVDEDEVPSRCAEF